MAIRTRSELSWYLEQIKSTPLLTAKQEQQLARRIREHSDIIAREEMIHANLRLVIKIATDFTGVGLSLTDLVAEGNIGLIRATEQFDPDAGVRFSTYAAWWIKQAIKQALNSTTQAIHVPDYLAKLIVKWRRTRAQMEVELGRPPSNEEVDTRLDLGEKKAAIVQEGLRAVSTPTQMDADEDETISGTLADEHGEAPDQHLLDESNGPIVAKLLMELPARQRKIVELRFGLDGYEGPQRTYKEIGKMIGLTRERVRQLEHDAMKQLRALDQHAI